QSLYQAIDFLPSAVQHPFKPFILVMESLQAAGIAAVILMCLYGELFNIPSLLFASILVVITTWIIRLYRQLNRHYRVTGAYQIATMLYELRKSRADTQERT